MPKLPSVSELTVSTPGKVYDRAMASGDSPMGRVVEQAGQKLTIAGDQMQEEQDRLDLSYAKSALLKSHLETVEALKDDPDFKTLTPRYVAAMEQTRKGVMGSLSGRAAQVFNADAQDYILRGSADVNGIARAKRTEDGRARSMAADDQDAKSYLTAPDDITRTEIVKNKLQRSTAEKNMGIYNADDAFVKDRAWIDQTLSERAESDIISGRLPSLKSAGGFESSMRVVRQNEGTANVSKDGNSGHPAIFGINERGHEAAYAEAKKISDEKGTAAGQAYADEFFKKEYWDKYNIGSLPTDVQDVVMDGAVNHWTNKEGTGFRDKLVQAARDGASREQLIDMRRKEYDRLINTVDEDGNRPYAASAKSWDGRLKRLSQGGGSYLSLLSPQAFERVKSRAQAYEGTRIQQDFSEIEQSANLGLPVPRETIDSLAIRADNANLPDYSLKLRKFADVQDKVNVFATDSLQNQQSQLTDLASKITAGQTEYVDQYAQAAKVFAKKTEMISKGEGWQYYAAHGVVKQPPAINLSDPNDVQNKLLMRRIDLATIQQKEGPGFQMPLFSGAEVDQLKTTYDKGSPDQIAASMTAVGSGLTPDERAGLSRQLAPDKPILAAVLNLPGKMAAQIIAGSKAQSAVPKADVDDLVDKQLSGLIQDPVAYEAVKDSAYAYYKSLSLEAGQNEQVPNKDLVNKAVNDILGGEPLEISPFGNSTKDTPFSTLLGYDLRSSSDKGRSSIAEPSKVLPYTKADGKTVTASDLEDILGSINEGMMKKLNGGLPIASDGDPIPMSEIVKRASWRTYGDGVYAANYPGLGVITGTDGRPYLFDARKIDAARKAK